MTWLTWGQGAILYWIFLPKEQAKAKVSRTTRRPEAYEDPQEWEGAASQRT